MIMTISQYANLTAIDLLESYELQATQGQIDSCEAKLWTFFHTVKNLPTGETLLNPHAIDNYAYYFIHEETNPITRQPSLTFLNTQTQTHEKIPTVTLMQRDDILNGLPREEAHHVCIIAGMVIAYHGKPSQQ